MMDSSEFEVIDLRLRYSLGSEFVLDNLNIVIKRGAIHVLLGQNGSGKSSLLKCMAGMQHWNSGDIIRRGKSRQDDYKDFNSDLIFVSEDVVLPNLPLKKLAEIYQEVWDVFDDALFQRVLSYANIEPKKYPRQLSRGQKALAQAALGLAAGIGTLLIDEVTAVLDPYVRNRLMAELIDQNRIRGTTIVIATNIATELQGLDPEVVLLDRGKIFLTGPFHTIQKQFLKILVPALANPPPAFVALSTLADGATTYIGRHESDIHSSDEVHEPVTLEQIFIFLCGRKTK